MRLRKGDDEHTRRGRERKKSCTYCKEAYEAIISVKLMSDIGRKQSPIAHPSHRKYCTEFILIYLLNLKNVYAKDFI
jgi:radical SAM superfamily enzyme